MLANDSGNTLSVVGLTVPSSGTARINPDRTVTFTPAAGFVGTVSFGYTISDGTGEPNMRRSIASCPACVIASDRGP